MKLLLKLTLYFLLVAGVISGLFFLSLGFLVSLHASKPEKADVIIVLGGDNGLRVRKGAELYNSGYASHVILTGIDERFYRPAHPNWRERRMMGFGVPKNAIKVDTQSTTTWEEAVNSVDTMKKKGWRHAIIVSDPPHMFRLYQTWSKAFDGSELSFILVSTRPEWWHPMLWWENSKSYQFVINEVKKNLFYTVMYY
ncbi:MAG: YdcF family protein [Chlorobiaceae bacterium]